MWGCVLSRPVGQWVLNKNTNRKGYLFLLTLSHLINYKYLTKKGGFTQYVYTKLVPRLTILI